MKNYRIFTKVFFSHTTVGLISLVSVSIIFYVLFREALIRRTIDQLSSINILKKNQIEVYFGDMSKDLTFQMNHYQPEKNIGVTEIASWRERYGFVSITLTDSSFYQIAATGQDSVVDKLLSVLREKPQSITAPEILDAAPLLSVSPAIIYAVPVNSATGVKSFVFIREDFEKIQRILKEATGMGTTGESYIVGKDLKMRSTSRFSADAPHSIVVNTTAVKKAFSGNPGGDIISDYRGIRVLSVYRSIDLPDLKWVIISEIDLEEAMGPVLVWRNYILITALIIFLLIIAITLGISNAITKPILYLKDRIMELSKGVIPAEEVKVEDTSEVGEIALALRDLTEGLKRTTEFAGQIGNGNFQASFITLSESDTLGHALIGMRDKLKNLSDEQIRLVRDKASALLEGQENERKRVVQELHDGVGQMLTAIRLRVDLLENEEIFKHEVLSLIHETTDEVKRISYNLMPNALVDFGLEPALRGLCENIKKYSSVFPDFKYVKEVNRKLNFEISIAVFRIIQEGLNNILKHASATAFELYFVENESSIYFILKDNGKGFSESSLPTTSGFGLRSMRERVKLLQGEFELQSSPGQGTIIEVSIPISKNTDS